MYRIILHIGLCSALLLSSGSAAAWVESTVRSHLVTVEVGRDGRAVVAHELLLRVRGGPLKSLPLEGVPVGVDYLPDATVAEAESNDARTLPLLLEAGDDGSLLLEIDDKKGLRSGGYLFRFRYAAPLSQHGALLRRGAWAELSYVAPRFGNGIDSVRAIFRVPATSVPPRLPTSERPDDGFDPALDGVFVAGTRRAGDHDEIELVRPHLAKQEPASWRIWVSPDAFEAFATATQASPSLPPSEPARSSERALPVVVAGLAAFLYALLVALKSMLVARDSRVASCVPRPLLPLPVAPRAAAAGVLAGVAVATAWLTEVPALAGAALLGAMAFAVHRAPAARPTPRGPGEWVVLEAEPALAPVRAEPSAGRWLDTGALPGFSLFACGLCGFVASGSALLRHSPYHAALAALASALLIPIFCTGRAAELPRDAVTLARPSLSWLRARLRRRSDVRVRTVVRLPAGSSQPDEMRLELVPSRAAAGLIAVEVAVECVEGVVAPCVIVRAADDSAAYRALPRSVVWSRGRSPSERAAVLRPKLPSRALCLTLLNGVLAALAAAPGAAQRRGVPASRTKAASSAGTASSTSKAGMPRAASQAT